MIDKKNIDYEYHKKILTSSLVDVKTLSDEFVIDMKYSSEDNFTGKQIYSLSLCILQISTARKLIEANKELIQEGFRIKIWDAYRPLSAQKLMWDIMPVHDFVADPNKGGSIHNGGFAVDVTLVDLDGRELEMPTKFDDFSEKASRMSTTMTAVAVQNLSLLTAVMVRHGFKTINSEWWHYYDEDLKQRIPLDISFEEIRVRQLKGK